MHVYTLDLCNIPVVLWFAKSYCMIPDIPVPERSLSE